MAVEKIVKTVLGDAPGRKTELIYFRIGPADADTKVFMQAATHADEQPGILVLHHLLHMLKEADQSGALNAEFVVFPMVNPIGMSDISFGQHQGRYDRVSGVNFNRQWPDLYEAIKDQVCADDLSAEIEENKQHIRRLVKAHLDKIKPVSALQQLRWLVMQEAYDADYVFDLHCDDDSLLHIFTLPQLMPELQPLANWTGAAGTLTAENSGGGSFDEVWSALWAELQVDYPDKPLHKCLSMTLEYRGQFDTFDDINLDDARRLFCYFQTIDLIEGGAHPYPHKVPGPTDLAATELIVAPAPGLVAYKVALGDKVKKGDVIAELVHLDGDEAFLQRTPVTCTTDGFVLSRSINKYAWAGCYIAKVVGEKVLQNRSGYLLED